MIKLVKGDFFEYEASIRVNTVNCVGVMGAGVALQFKNKFPKMFEDYAKECHLGKVKPGVPHVWNNNQLFNDNPIIINLPTKLHWKNPSKYEYIIAGLIWLRSFLKDKSLATVTLPALGCGHGGLNWDKVQKLIFEYLHDLNVTILLFEPESSTKKSLYFESIDDLKEKKVIKFLPNDPDCPNKIKDKIVSEIYIKGNINLLNLKILSIVVDPKAEDREKEAVKNCLDIIPNIGFAFIIDYNSSFEIDLVKTLLMRKSNVIINLPYGIFEIKIRKDLIEHWDENRILVCSLAKPEEKWKINTSINALKFTFKLADLVLITNFSYNSLEKYKQDLINATGEIFYINYWNHNIEFYDIINARKIGKSSKTHLPNLNPIIDTLYKR